MSGTGCWAADPAKYCKLVLLAFATASSALGQPEDGWKNLTKVRHDRGYTVVSREGSCIDGTLTDVTESFLKLETVLTSKGIPTGEVVRTSINRPDVLRVSDNRDALVHDGVYSGRSSWADVKDARPYSKSESLKLVLHDGRIARCNGSDISDDLIVCGAAAFPKIEVSRAYYVRLKPASSGQLYLSHEGMAWLDARTWFNYALYGRIDVLLYQSSRQEDNAPVKCRSWPLSPPNR